MSSNSRTSRRSSEDELNHMITNLQHLDLSGHVFSDSAVLKAHGGYCDVFVGRWMKEGVCIYKVAIKRLRVHVQRDRDFARLLVKEIRVWSTLAHRNILPLLGFIVEGDYPSLISEWMENGTASRYVEDHPECNVFELILGIAEGLKYLHERSVIHSDIKADNVLISRTGEPRICDFGISRVLAASQTLASSTSGPLRGSVRWMAFELFKINPPPVHTTYTDIWAFGMTVHELLARELPYAHFKLDLHVMFAIMGKLRPTQPASFDTWPTRHQKVWNMCHVCWDPDPSRRYPMHYVVSYLKFISTFKESENEAGQSTGTSVNHNYTTDSIADQMKTKLQLVANDLEQVYDRKNISSDQPPRSNYSRKTSSRSGDLSRHHSHFYLESSLDATLVTSDQSRVRTGHSPTTIVHTERVDQIGASSTSLYPANLTTVNSLLPAQDVTVPIKWSPSASSDGLQESYDKVQNWIQVLEHEGTACSPGPSLSTPPPPSPPPSTADSRAAVCNPSNRGSLSSFVDIVDVVSERDGVTLPPEFVNESGDGQTTSAFDKNGIEAWRRSISDETQRDEDVQAEVPKDDSPAQTVVKKEASTSHVTRTTEEPPRTRRTLRRITGTVPRGFAA